MKIPIVGWFNHEKPFLQKKKLSYISSEVKKKFLKLFVNIGWITLWLKKIDNRETKRKRIEAHRMQFIGF